MLVIGGHIGTDEARSGTHKKPFVKVIQMQTVLIIH
jgi:hypothetical protein